MTLPPPGFSTRSLVTAVLPVGDVWRRFYRTRFPNPLGWGAGLTRFSDPTGALFGVIYLGSTLKVCFAETIHRDRADGRLDALPVETSELNDWMVAKAEVAEPVTLIDLTGDGPLAMGVPSDVTGARDQTLAHAWSEAFWRHSDDIDGVLFPSRLIEQRNVAIYSRALAKFRVSAVDNLMATGAELAQVLDDLNVALIRS